MFKQLGFPADTDPILAKVRVDCIETLDAVETNETIINVYYDVHKVRGRSKEAMQQRIYAAVAEATEYMFAGHKTLDVVWNDEQYKVLKASVVFYTAKGLIRKKKKQEATN